MGILSLIGLEMWAAAEIAASNETLGIITLVVTIIFAWLDEWCGVIIDGEKIVIEEGELTIRRNDESSGGSEK